MLYKITSKIIAECLKDTLSTFISNEQYGFLKGRSIHDATTIAQEVLHSIHTEKREAIVIKVDLHKAYDSINWSYIRLVLLKIGLPIRIIRWIMTCISTVRFVVIINGIPTHLFSVGRGLRQGCALSPLFFILIMDGFSGLMHMAEQKGFIKGFSFSNSVSSSHSLFVDDLLLFGYLNRNHWFYIHYMFIRFESATGLAINKNKSFIIYEYGDPREIAFIAGFLGVECKEAFSGFTYLSF